MSVYENEYRPPADGSPDSADPAFRARLRPCGRCGAEFKTSAKWRYFCKSCRQTPLVQKGLRQTFSITHAKGAKGAAQ